ncbi:MAG: nuclear transport factor 2 family protein [Bacteroidales bacterium]|nr:nuclear transport factor 2 family protein [Bacteroidales bacterium]
MSPKLISMVLIVLLSGVFFPKNKNEEIAIKQIIQSAYVDGIQNNGNLEDFEEGFHSGFNFLEVHSDMLIKNSIYNWIKSIKDRKLKTPESFVGDKRVTCKYLLIDITGNSAMAKIQLFRDQKLLFTDYLQLYKFEEVWKIVSKIYYRH